MHLVLNILFWIFVIIACLYWCIEFIAYFLIRKHCPRIDDMPDGDLPEWPRVSLIMTACNEENSIENAIKEKLNDDYPNLEFILVEDRSTDKTPQIADKLAAENPGLKVIHVKELPEGWLGKVNALNQGVKTAGGEWLIFSDADVRIKPGTIKRAIVFAEKNKYDHIAIFPHLLRTKCLLDATLSVFIRMLCIGGRVWKACDPRSDAAVGSGSFNMVKRITLQNSSGLEDIKLEPGDDVALGMMLKADGARGCLLSGRQRIPIHWFHDLKGMAASAERATFTSLGNFSFLRIILYFLILTALELAPFIIFFNGFNNGLWITGLILIVMSYLSTALLCQWWGDLSKCVLLWPVGALIIAAIALRAGYLGVRRGGIYWRGTFYSTELLRSGKRVRINTVGTFKSNPR